MSEIQHASSTPPYIDDFLKKNMVQLVDIHDEGIKENGTGCLGFKCSQNENKMDVFYMNEESMLTMPQLSKEEKMSAISQSEIYKLTEQEVIRLAIIRLAKGIKDESITKLTNSKKIKQDKLAEEWAKLKKDKPASIKRDTRLLPGIQQTSKIRYLQAQEH